MPKGKPNKKYTPEFKIMVVETMQKEGLSYSETSNRFEINSHNRVRQWERIYLEEGAEGLRIERRESQQDVRQSWRRKSRRI